MDSQNHKPRRNKLITCDDWLSELNNPVLKMQLQMLWSG